MTDRWDKGRLDTTSMARPVAQSTPSRLATVLALIMLIVLGAGAAFVLVIALHGGLLGVGI